MVSFPVVAAGLFLSSAAWMAAASPGLMGHPLRKGFEILLLSAAAMLAAGPRVKFRRRQNSSGEAGPSSASSSSSNPLWNVAAVLGSIAAVAGMMLAPAPSTQVLAAAFAAAMTARLRSGVERNALRAVAAALFAFAVFRLLSDSVPHFWQATDLIGGAMSAAAGSLGRLFGGGALWTGATYSGLDFLALTISLGAARLFLGPNGDPRSDKSGAVGGNARISPRSAIAFGALIVASHVLYLVALPLLLKIPDIVPLHEAVRDGAVMKPPGPWHARIVHALLPWDAPAFALLIHLALIAAILRSGQWPSQNVNGPSRRITSPVLAVGLAVALPLVSMLTAGSATLKGKKIVFYEKGFLNWLKPEHGEYGRFSIGMYGMMPRYLASLGAQCVISPDLSPKDLAGAQAVVLLFPDEKWEEGQLERVWNFVRAGGSLMVMGEHTVVGIEKRDSETGLKTNVESATTGTLDLNAPVNAFNQALAPTAMRVRFDSASFAIGGWLHSYQTLGHPTTADMADDRNLFGSVIGASVRARWPANPWLIGRWGWNDPGNAAGDDSKMGNHKYDPGEKLGDATLAAEQRLGKGRVILFGDTSGVTNGINVSSHVYTSRLFAYLTSNLASPHAPWRQFLAALLGLALAGLALSRPVPSAMILSALALASFSFLAEWRTSRIFQDLPDGRGVSPNNLAYIDASHLASSSEESARVDGTIGLAMTLMRNGYLTLALPDLSKERLDRAGLLVSIAPWRAYSARERRTVADFIANGGIFIATVGWEEREPGRYLLEDLKFTVGLPPGGDPGSDEPMPMGFFKAPFYPHDSGEYSFVRFNAAWPVFSSDPEVRPFAYGPGNTSVILMRQIGRGFAVLVGDTGFAMNKNLEHEDGSPFDGMRENADFWRWLLSYLRGPELWIPPDPKAASAPVAGTDSPTSASAELDGGGGVAK